MSLGFADYEVVIGLEIHAELSTASKIFCGCSTEFGGEPNTRVCPVCLGLPGALPVLNEKALEYAVKAGLALNCEIATYSKFDRKNYFYPDLPKAYQISQYDLPLCRRGWVVIPVGETERRVGITRVHLEEEAGKLVHAGESIVGAAYSLVDYNRSGIPLIEIVTEPDLRSPEEARLFLEELRAILRYTGVSDVKMEEGSLRCDANISLRPRGSERFGTKTEVKNMNSFRAVERALAYEATRQYRLLSRGEAVVQETRAWVEARGETVPLRSKEEAHDYRYFPEPDLVPVVPEAAWVEKWRAELPELPGARRRRFREAYGLPAYDAGVLTSARELADFFEAALAAYGGEPKVVSNWVMGELLRLLKESPGGVEALPRARVTPGGLAELLRLVDDGTLSGSGAKTVFEEMFRTGRSAAEIVEERGLRQIGGAEELRSVVRDVLAANPGAVEDYRGGKKQAVGFLVGKVMQATRGRANPKVAGSLIEEELEAGGP